MVGWILVAVGVLSLPVDLSESNQLLTQINGVWIAQPPIIETFAVVLAVLSILAAGGGTFLIGFARGERDREEDLRLDPLTYAPFRHPWRRILPWCGVIVALMVLPTLLFLPVGHSFQASLGIGDCAVPETGSVFDVNLPSGAILTYYWTSSDGQPVTEVWAPVGPAVVSSASASYAFYNSTYGYSGLQSDGTTLGFWACDNSVSAEGNTVNLVGVYYTNIL